MKHIKKMMALVIAVAMVLAMSAVAFAAPADVSDTYKVSSVEVDGIKAGNTLKLYKVVSFKLDPATNEVDYTLAETLPEAYDTIDELGALEGNSYVYNNDAATKTCADVLANAIAAGTLSPLATVTQAAGEGDKAVVTDLPAGWYVAVVSGTEDDSIIYQNMIINAMPVVDSENNSYKKAEDVKFDVKSTKDTVEKTVAEGTSTDAYSVGDSVPYTIETNIPNYPTPSKNATFVIKDTPTGLTDTLSTVKVTVAGDAETGTAAGSVTGKFAVEAAGAGFTVTFEKDYLLAHPGAKVTVEYKAVINSDATIAADGKTAENTASIKFNPNPNEADTVEPDDTTKVYTYGVDVFKRDKTSQQKLTGAKFILYKEDGKTVAGAEKEVDANGYVSWDGLGAGTYKLVETKAPTGYKLDSNPITVTISKETANKDNRATESVEQNFVQADVDNEQGSTLPSTGGMGTTIFYIVGAILVIGGGILLVSRRRMSAE